MSKNPASKNLARDEENKRRHLLAVVQLAKKELRFTDQKYRRTLASLYDIPTSSGLSNDQLWDFIWFLMWDYEWAPPGYKRPDITLKKEIQSLHFDILMFTPRVPGGVARVLDLCHSICGVDRIEWCTDIKKMKKLLEAMGDIILKEGKVPLKEAYKSNHPSKGKKKGPGNRS